LAIKQYFSTLAGTGDVLELHKEFALKFTV
jgi:hypothetical protein